MSSCAALCRYPCTHHSGFNRFGCPQQNYAGRLEETLKAIVFISACVALAPVLGPSVACADSLAYFTDYGDDFGTVDLNTGSYHVIEVLPNNLGGIGYGPNRALYGLDWTDTLVKINPGTAAVTTVGASGLNVHGAAGQQQYPIYFVIQWQAVRRGNE